MEVTGYQLREALKQWGLRKTALEEIFTDSLHKFENETKESPEKTFVALQMAEAAIVALQVAQMQYNLAITLDIPTVGSVTLAHAIKLAGAAERGEKLWKGAASKKTSYYHSELVREANQVRATQTLTAHTILAQTETASKKVSHLRAAIATANAQKVDLKDLEAALFG